jgi:hypothetical protein
MYRRTKSSPVAKEVNRGETQNNDNWVLKSGWMLDNMVNGLMELPLGSRTGWGAGVRKGDGC